MMTRRRSSLRFSLLLALMAPAIGYSQSAASLRGTITDPQGAAVSEAAINLTNTQTGLIRKTLTNASGEYQFLQLPPGAYSLGAEKPGFSSLSRSDVNLLVNTVILNYMALHGQQGNFATTIANNGLGTGLDALIAFNPIVNGVIGA